MQLSLLMKFAGPYGEENGFKEAAILLSNGKEDKGFGGGVCQLSTTLYNAVKNLDTNEWPIQSNR